MSTITEVYYPGSGVLLSVTFTDSDNAEVDPDTVSLKLTDPDGVAQTITGGSITRDGTGLYHYSFTVDTAGEWFYEWTGAGTLAVVNLGSFVVREGQ